MDLFSNKKDVPAAPNAAPGQNAGGFGSSLFGGNNAPGGAGKAPAGPGLADVEKDMNTLSRKLRINEERTIDLRKKMQVIEHNMLSSHKKIINELRFVNEEIAELRLQLNEMKTKFVGFSREMKGFAKHDDVEVLNKYINMWEPIQFVTRKEAERLITEILEEKGIK